jgi:thiamine pyrophosphate-dependent acetolactate synthase large subunit-like protein
MVGHSNLGLAEAIRRRCQSGDLDFIGVRHEGAASFAASAYAKLSGKPTACLAIAGPGASNLLTGLWDAKLDRVPILALSGQVDLQFLGPGLSRKSIWRRPLTASAVGVKPYSNRATMPN